MKTIGLIGGMSWESSAEYYRLMNQHVKAILGGHHNARSLMLTVDFSEIEELQHQGNWTKLGEEMQRCAKQLQAAGADFLVLCTNTMHKLSGEIEAAISIPFLHIADPTAEAIQSRGLRTVGLLGTRFTMEEEFYRGRLQSKYDLKVLIPEEGDRRIIHSIIYDELCHGKILAESRSEFQRIINGLKQQGAQAVILGCTEITLLIQSEDSSLPVFDTTALHAYAAVNLALGQ
jgi:aspartate racemase